MNRFDRLAARVIVSFGSEAVRVKSRAAQARARPGPQELGNRSKMMADTTSTQVLIIGAGPSGATLALLLAQLGIKTIAISRHKSTANTPRAHIFNQRAMEILRATGLEKQVSEVATDSENMAHTTWSHTLAGEEYGRIWAWGNKPSEQHRYEMASHCKMSDLPQSY